MFDTKTNQFNEENFPGENEPKKKILLIIIPVLIIGLLIAAFFIFKYLNNKPQITPVKVIEVATNTPATLPIEVSTSTDDMADLVIPDAIEKITFADFYREPAPLPEFKLKDYKLPMNIKIDALNYHDVNRKFDLSKGLDNLNNNGFAIFDNPASAEANNFYGAYSFLSKKDVPLLITSDFLLHYHQNVLKQVYKDIEENVFYDNLVIIIKSLYQSSKDRYESRLSKIGGVNDSVLEGERLSMAYFAVTLKLLEPTSAQIDPSGKNLDMFSPQEAQNLYFNVLPYLKNDVLAEVEQIKMGGGIKKSPVLLYNKDYKDFVVPLEYKSNERLYNFYLASTWLNSVFPLVVNDKNCPTCLLDKNDSYVNLIAASFITKDFASNQSLKNRWALIYKLISYDKGLRDDLTYLHYDQEMKKLFGDDYDPEIVFAERNPDKTKNLDKFRANLLAINFNDFQGALDKKKDKSRLGFKLLTDYYWPNSYVFDNLRTDKVGAYQSGRPKGNNITACDTEPLRCTGFGFDIIGLIEDRIANYDYWKENTDYAGYDKNLNEIKNAFSKTMVWYTNRFWSLLDILKTMLEQNGGQIHAYAKTVDWQQRLANASVSAWVDLQLPLEPLLPTSENTEGVGGLSTSVATGEDYYIEPNYSLIQKLIAENEMVSGMIDALNINKQVSAVSLSLKAENEKLKKVEEIIKKELNEETLTLSEQSFISSFAGQYKLSGTPVQSFNLNFGKDELVESLGVKFMALAYQLGGEKYIAIGPIFSFSELR